MSWTITLILMFGLAGLTVFSAWRGARPPDLIKGPRMVPWRGVMVFSAMGAMMMLVHVVNLLGMHTGR